MNSYLYTVLMLGVWLLNLTFNTELGVSYHTTEIAQLAAVGIALYYFFRQAARDQALLAPRRYFNVFAPLAAVFLLSCWFAGNIGEAVDYLWAYLIVYSLANISVSKKTMRLVGNCFAVLGAAILAIFCFGSELDGWNANSIAMIGLFSFLIFLIPYFGVVDRKSKILLSAAGVVFAFMLNETGSRSCIVVIFAALLISFRVIPSKKLLRSRKALFAVLLVPLAVAIFVVVISQTALGNELNNWSLSRFGKPIFNGRDQIWLDGFRRLMENFFFGRGVFNSGYWHNCAIGCLTTVGAVGYFLWLGGFHLLLCEARKYSRDVGIAGCMVAFLALYCQQSFELGLLSPNPNMLPYVILGMMLGRVRYLREQRRYGD